MLKYILGVCRTNVRSIGPAFRRRCTICICGRSENKAEKNNAAEQSQNKVPAYFISKDLLPLGFTENNVCIYGLVNMRRLIRLLIITAIHSQKEVTLGFLSKQLCPLSFPCRLGSVTSLYQPPGPVFSECLTHILDMWLVEMAISTNHMSKIRVKNTEHTAVESQKEITAYFKFQVRCFN